MKVNTMKETKANQLGNPSVTFFCIVILFGFLSFSDVSSQTLAGDTLAVREILAWNGLLDSDMSSYVVVRDGRIGELRLSNLGLTEIPPDIGNLTALVLLNLSNNSLETLPNAIGNCTSLQNIYLQNNNLTELPAGITSIPLSHSFQTTVYGCQIYLDGSCIQYGPVLGDTTVQTRADLGGNRLCNESPGTTSWANSVDPDWESTQSCGSIVITPDNFMNQTGSPLYIYNLKGRIVKRFSEDSREPAADEFKWNGRDDQGQPIPAGIYFLGNNRGISEKIIIAN
jgi:hypothetical protein